MKATSIIQILVFLLAGCDKGPPEEALPVAPDTTTIDPLAPRLSLVIGIESGVYALEWSEVQGATGYTLQWDFLPTFTNPTVVYERHALMYELGFTSDYSYSSYYRVRADGTNTGWSNAIKFPD